LVQLLHARTNDAGLRFRQSLRLKHKLDERRDVIVVGTALDQAPDVALF
jgi:hypothetical protein